MEGGGSVCVCEVVCRARKVPSHKRLLPLPRFLAPSAAPSTAASRLPLRFLGGLKGRGGVRGKEGMGAVALPSVVGPLGSS